MNYINELHFRITFIFYILRLHVNLHFTFYIHILHSNNSTDINECLLNTHDCDKTSTCRNFPGFYTCQCASGLRSEVYDYIRVCEGDFQICQMGFNDFLK